MRPTFTSTPQFIEYRPFHYLICCSNKLPLAHILAPSHSKWNIRLKQMALPSPQIRSIECAEIPSCCGAEILPPRIYPVCIRVMHNVFPVPQPATLFMPPTLTSTEVRSTWTSWAPHHFAVALILSPQLRARSFCLVFLVSKSPPCIASRVLFYIAILDHYKAL